MVQDSSRTKRIAPGVLLERNLAIPMRDGVRLVANVFRPAGDGSHPAILSATPYGKDNLPDWKGMLLMRLSGVRFGHLHCSRWTGFESHDPFYWVQQSYAVVQADVRGMHGSEGSAGVLRDEDAQDYAELIAWTACQPWCDGKIGLLGVSYLAMSQWRVAALNPPALRAICPWEGVTDLLREFAFQEGVPETTFIPLWWKNRIQRGRNRRFPPGEDFPAEIDRHPLDDGYWADKRPALKSIEVPALVCASWSDQGLHTRGSFLGFERIGSKRIGSKRIGSKQKWLFTHGRKKWETFYNEEAVALQTCFFDRFLKGLDNGMEATPSVRLERRRAFYQADIRNEAAWPLPQVQPTSLYLSAAPTVLEPKPCDAEGVVAYRSTSRWRRRRATFVYAFDAEVELKWRVLMHRWRQVRTNLG